MVWTSKILKDKTRRGKVEDSPLYKRTGQRVRRSVRLRLMPFFWGTLIKEHGSIAGTACPRERSHDDKQDVVLISWLLRSPCTGQAHDDVINSNDKKRNPYPSVLEFLKRKLKLDSKQVASFGSWDVFNWIAEHEEGAITINAGHEPYEHPDPEIRVLSKLQNEKLSPWDSVRMDYFTMRFAMAHLKSYEPRVLHIALGETDDWAHDGDYAHVLEALERNDRQLRELWEFLQSSARYRGKTSILITVDHGRGNTVKDWTDHGEKVPEAQYIWMAVISPDVSLRGEWSKAETIYQNQVAATLSRFLNFDYSEQNAEAGKPIGRLFAR